ncbi:polyphenol oxidase family protein [Patescibacteria group bacterium]
MEKMVRSQLLLKTGIIQATSTKHAGNMAFMQSRNQDGLAQQNLDQFFKLLGLVGIKSTTLYLLDATHSSNTAITTFANEKGRLILGQKSPGILILKKHELNHKFQQALEEAGSGHLLKQIEQGVDAAICHRPNVFLGLLHADCSPICIYDPMSQFYALIHAGTLGALNGIVANTINLMKRECGVRPNSLLAYIGPCIADANYNITYSVYWPIIKQVMSREEAEKLDLKTILKNQLIKAGLQEANIEVSQFCTAANDLFFSNHKAQDPVSEGRNLTIIGM